MTRRHILLAAFAGLLIGTNALAADVRENRAVSGFSDIRLAVPAKLEVIQGSSEALTIEGPAEDVAKVETVVEQGVLHIRRPKSDQPIRWDNWKPRLNIVVNATRVESLAISGSGKVSAKSLRTPSLKLAISGSGDIAMPSVDTEKVVASISGSGNIAVGGRAGSIASHISGSGDVRAERLETRQATVSISGSGDVAVWARDSLDVRIGGAGDVRYYGDPTVQKKIAGSGSVKRLGLAPT